MVHALYFDNTVFVGEGGGRYAECGNQKHHRERKVHGTYMCRRGCVEEANTTGRGGTIEEKRNQQLRVHRTLPICSQNLCMNRWAGNQHIQIHVLVSHLYAIW